MKLGTILIFCVLVIQKVAAQADSDKPISYDKTFRPHSTPATELIYDDFPDYFVPNETRTKVTSQPNEPQGFSSAQFSMGLYEAVKEDQPQNFVISLLSLRNALAMLNLGATGETAEEIQEALQLPANASKLINRQSNLTALLKGLSSGNSSVKFVTADKIYANSGFRIETEYQKNVKQLGGEIENIDFGKSEEAAGKINSWFRNKTEGKIDKIVEASDLNIHIPLLVLNSIYFKGSWEKKFNVSDTKQRPFLINASCSVNVEMMTQKNKFQLADLEDAKAQVILLPYQGGRLSMMIYLPYKNKSDSSSSSLDTLENWLKDQSPFDIQKEYLNEDKPSTISVSLPKFKIRSSLDLKEPLRYWGLPKMFNPFKADFKGMFKGFQHFFVDQVSQETFIEVNEEGAEAAAATVVGSQLPEFTVNRPFLFQIVDNETETILFSGRVKNPLASLNSPNSDSLDGCSQCIEATLKETEICVAKPEVEEMLLDFLNLLAPNKTDGNAMKNPSPTSSLQGLLKKYENETRGATRFLQGVNNTLKRLDKTEKKLELEKPDCSQNSSEITPAPSGTLSENTTIIEDAPKSATAWGWGYAKSGQGPPMVQKYNVTVHGSCFDFYINIQSVHLTGSCVTLYREYDCGGQKFRLDRTNVNLGWDIQRQFPSRITGYYLPKSIGICK